VLYVPSKPTKQAAGITLPQFKLTKMTLIGETPLIVHRFAEKAKKQILSKQQGKNPKKKEFREPEKEYEAAKYKLSDGSDGFPALCIKQAVVDSARFFDDLPMTFLRGVIFIVPDDLDTGLMKLDYSHEEMVEDTIRLSGGGTSDLRYRPYYYDWKIKAQVKYDAGLITLDQLGALFVRAGMSQGLGEWRPERNGQNGIFNIEEVVGKKS